MSIGHQSTTELVHAFSKARQANDPDALRVWLAGDVVGTSRSSPIMWDSFEGDRIVEASFYPSNINNDQAF